MKTRCISNCQGIVIVACVIFSLVRAIHAHASEFEIDEIVTAIKNEIQTANSAELGTPSFVIETVDVALSIATKETEKGDFALKIFSAGDEFQPFAAPSKSYHQLHYSFHPTGTSSFSPEISLGLVEPIKRAMSSFRKACIAPPSTRLDGFNFILEFAIVDDIDETIRFTILGLEELKARDIATHKLKLHIKIASSS